MGDTLKRKGCDTMHILVVEDDHLLNNTLCYNLNAAGYKVDSALCKKEAEHYIEKQKYELIVLDVNLPDGNGFDFCKEAKERCPETAVIFLTANDMESDMLKGYELGADDYVTKPFPMSVFQKKLAALLSRIAKQSEEDQYFPKKKNWIRFPELQSGAGFERVRKYRASGRTGRRKGGQKLFRGSCGIFGTEREAEQYAE